MIELRCRVQGLRLKVERVSGLGRKGRGFTRRRLGEGIRGSGLGTMLVAESNLKKQLKLFSDLSD